MSKTLHMALGLALLFVCCRKKTTEPTADEEPPKKIDTLKPLPYFPAFPGSYWKYVDSKNKTITYSTSLTYEKDTYEDWADDKLLRTETAYVPRYNGMTIWGYSKRTGPIINYNMVFVYSLIPVVSETVGDMWMTYAVSHNYAGAQVIAKDTSIQIDGKTYFPTIVVNLTAGYGQTNTVITGREYYTKDIGLVKKEFLKVPAGIVESEMHLVDYFINK